MAPYCSILVHIDPYCPYCSILVPYRPVLSFRVHLVGTAWEHALQHSSLKRASRSLAKTGFCWGLWGCLFPPLFLVSFLRVHGGSFGFQWLPLGIIWEPFLQLVYDFWEVGRISGNWCPSLAKTYFLRFWGSIFSTHFGTFHRPWFQLQFQTYFLQFVCTFGSPMGPKWVILGCLWAN